MSDDHSRGHVLHYTVEQVKTLVVIGLGRDELLEHAEETRLEKQSMAMNKVCKVSICYIIILYCSTTIGNYKN